MTPAPVGLLAELTHRCPLACPYCSNPLDLDPKRNELDTAAWQRVFAEAAGLGVLHVHLSGGEPAARPDLEALVATCAANTLYSNLITSGIGLSPARITALAAAGLDHVQLSIQHADAAPADRIAGYRGAAARKAEVARAVVAAGLPLTVNVVLHRANLEAVAEIAALAERMGARRLELAHAQYYGWGLANRAALQGPRAKVLAAVREVEGLKARYAGRLVIDHVLPDYFARHPKACMGGWGRRSLNVTPSGKVLPCHGAERIPGLDVWSVADHALGDIWTSSPAFNAFRGTSWMQEPCASCPRREVDFGGCRCQALALAGDARATDPVCVYSPKRAEIDRLLSQEAQAPPPYRYRARV
ncbi:pyrroloquinoline quinone biosynthesis protein PqqE [Aquabacter spiritensis]|uniref:PqqA peptide cyclase n=1 Tax=Aquabacter spiritensis TaxID=933073 RepID=A0A4R3LUS5_9HYPH|nr:pyrroloquinoline quinone biosynthesis protein PqqE [Aquabacter spiritensis]TCT04274.1 pyrroloquinoline quinone biosynthesis protein E [Aquabacter spiritensis]